CTMRPEPSMNRLLALRKAVSWSARDQLLREIPEVLANALGDSIAGEAAIQNLIELAGYVEIKLHRVAVVEVRIAALDVHEGHRSTAGLAVHGQSQDRVPKVVQRLERHSHALSGADQSGRRRPRRVAQGSRTGRRESRVVDDDSVAGNIDGDAA